MGDPPARPPRLLAGLVALAGRLPTRYRHALAGTLLGTVALALALPVGLPPDAPLGSGSNDLDGAPPEVGAEDLSAFLASRRWGASLKEIRRTNAAAADGDPVLNPVLAEMGFVGLIVAGDGSAMLLRLPGGDVVRLTLGDETPDGRTLSSVSDNTVTLYGADGRAEVLELFPRVVPEPADGPGD